MNISDRNYTKTLNFLLLLIAVTMIFRKPCTWLIILFAVFQLIFVKKLTYSKASLWLALLIASPLVLEIIMFWNNDSLLKGFKSLEKYLSLMVFGLCILGNYKRIHFIKILRHYCVTSILLMLVFFFRFVFYYPDLIRKYIKGDDLWEIGYAFANSIGIHAPALNMHLSFISVACLFFVFKAKGEQLHKASSIIIFVLSFFFILFVNTRMAFVNALLGFLLVFYFEAIQRFQTKKVLGIGALLFVLLCGVFYIFVGLNPYMKEKYSRVTFAHMDKIGKLDQIENPESEVFNALVTRISIWKSGWELALEHLPMGTGASDSKAELIKYYKKTNQHFLAKYEFPTHNQFLDFFIKFGFLGPIVVLIYMGTILYLGIDVKNALILSFFLLFFNSNLTDDFLLRFDGIAFSGLWVSIFGSQYLQKKLASVQRG